MIKIRLTRENKISLTILAIFLTLAGYYSFVFEPVYNKWKESNKKVKGLKKELMQQNRKLSLRERIRRTQKEMYAQMGDIKARIEPGLIKGALGERVKAIMEQAESQGVSITNLRPVSIILPDTQETVYEFILEGKARIENFLAFLDHLWGLGIEELNFNINQRGGEAQFFLKLSSFPKDAVALLEGIKAKPASEPREEKKYYKALSFKEKLAESPPPIPSPEPSPEPLINTDGLRLVGIGFLGKQKMAVIIDEIENKDFFLKVGDNIRDYKIKKIFEDGVLLGDQEGNRAELKFSVNEPEGGSEIAEPEQQEGTDKLPENSP